MNYEKDFFYFTYLLFTLIFVWYHYTEFTINTFFIRTGDISSDLVIIDFAEFMFYAGAFGDLALSDRFYAEVFSILFPAAVYLVTFGLADLLPQEGSLSVAPVFR